ncbi:MAG TPA: DNA primase [Candidatus Saccharimonadales bacterium]|nr:DNA primase [Candidatus Saccharimonadales bacterium]
MDAVEEVKNRLAIEDVIGEYVQLKRAGHNWRGLSPFGNEKTPSFMVSPEKQIWHDFSSNKGGNMFSFVMEIEGLDFRGALELLANKAGVDLEQYQRSAGRGDAKQKERLYEALKLTAKFYQAHFSKNQTALEYILKERQFSKSTALEWQIGYAPNSGTALLDFLKSKNFTDDEIKRAGLSTQRYQGSVDMFRGRIMIPLADQQGRIIGFTARLLHDDPSAPKYINTPQTILYDKSRHVFGLHLAKEAIRKAKYAVVTEGNLDVITSHQAGVRQVVATAGTALTEQHLKALSRFVNDIRLSFDADRAGLNATERAIPIAGKVGVSLSVITLTTGKDPDELIKRSPGKWQKAIDESVYALDWLIEYFKQQFDLDTAAGKRQFSDDIMPIVQNLTDKVEQDHYVQKIAEILQVSREALLTKLKPEPATRLKHRLVKPEPVDKLAAEMGKNQDHFLSLVLQQPKLRDFLEPITEGMLSTLPAQQLLQFLRDNPEFAGDVGTAMALEPVAEYVKILVLQYETLYQELDLLELRYEAAHLQTRLIERYVKTQKRELSSQLQTTNDADTDRLLARAKQLDILLKQAKES